MNLLRQIKSNNIVRSFFQFILGNFETYRPYRTVAARLYFLGGRHLNIFFSRVAEQEPVITENIIKFIRDGDSVFDIGANIGYYTVLFAKLVPKGRVIAVEPDINNLKWLRKNISNNKLKNTIIIDKAISNEEHVVDFYVDRNTGRTSSLSQAVFHPGGRYSLSKTIVNTVTCDSLSLSDKPNLIKCDIEGHEIAFLRGATQTLKHRPVVMMEVKEENKEEVLNILSTAGYSIFDAEQPWSLTSKPILRIESANILAIPVGYNRANL